MELYKTSCLCSKGLVSAREMRQDYGVDSDGTEEVLMVPFGSTISIFTVPLLASTME